MSPCQKKLCSRSSSRFEIRDFWPIQLACLGWRINQMIDDGLLMSLDCIWYLVPGIWYLVSGIWSSICYACLLFCVSVPSRVISILS